MFEHHLQYIPDVVQVAKSVLLYAAHPAAIGAIGTDGYPLLDDELLPGGGVVVAVVLPVVVVGATYAPA